VNWRPGRIRSFPAAIALLAGTVVLGCSAVGYGFGGILATMDRRDVAATDLGLVFFIMTRDHKFHPSSP
jgi:hypothetical protein